MRGRGEGRVEIDVVVEVGVVESILWTFLPRVPKKCENIDDKYRWNLSKISGDVELCRLCNRRGGGGVEVGM